MASVSKSSRDAFLDLGAWREDNDVLEGAFLETGLYLGQKEIIEPFVASGLTDTLPANPLLLLVWKLETAIRDDSFSSFGRAVGLLEEVPQLAEGFRHNEQYINMLVDCKTVAVLCEFIVHKSCHTNAEMYTVLNTYFDPTLYSSQKDSEVKDKPQPAGQSNAALEAWSLSLHQYARRQLELLILKPAKRRNLAKKLDPQSMKQMLMGHCSALADEIRNTVPLPRLLLQGRTADGRGCEVSGSAGPSVEAWVANPETTPLKPFAIVVEKIAPSHPHHPPHHPPHPHHPPSPHPTLEEPASEEESDSDIEVCDIHETPSPSSSSPEIGSQYRPSHHIWEFQDLPPRKSSRRRNTKNTSPFKPSSDKVRATRQSSRGVRASEISERSPERVLHDEATLRPSPRMRLRNAPRSLRTLQAPHSGSSPQSHMTSPKPQPITATEASIADSSPFQGNAGALQNIGGQLSSDEDETCFHEEEDEEFRSPRPKRLCTTDVSMSPRRNYRVAPRKTLRSSSVSSLEDAAESPALIQFTPRRLFRRCLSSAEGSSSDDGGDDGNSKPGESDAGYESPLPIIEGIMHKSDSPLQTDGAEKSLVSKMESERGDVPEATASSGVQPSLSDSTVDEGDLSECDLSDTDRWLMEKASESSPHRIAKTQGASQSSRTSASEPFDEEPQAVKSLHRGKLKAKKRAKEIYSVSTRKSSSVRDGDRSTLPHGTIPETPKKSPNTRAMSKRRATTKEDIIEDDVHTLSPPLKVVRQSPRFKRAPREVTHLTQQLADKPMPKSVRERRLKELEMQSLADVSSVCTRSRTLKEVKLSSEANSAQEKVSSGDDSESAHVENASDSTDSNASDEEGRKSPNSPVVDSTSGDQSSRNDKAVLSKRSLTYKKLQQKHLRVFQGKKFRVAWSKKQQLRTVLKSPTTANTLANIRAIPSSPIAGNTMSPKRKKRRLLEKKVHFDSSPDVLTIDTSMLEKERANEEEEEEEEGQFYPEKQAIVLEHTPPKKQELSPKDASVNRGDLSRGGNLRQELLQSTSSQLREKEQVMSSGPDNSTAESIESDEISLQGELPVPQGHHQKSWTDFEAQISTTVNNEGSNETDASQFEVNIGSSETSGGTFGDSEDTSPAKTLRSGRKIRQTTKARDCESRSSGASKKGQAVMLPGLTVPMCALKKSSTEEEAMEEVSTQEKPENGHKSEASVVFRRSQRIMNKPSKTQQAQLLTTDVEPSNLQQTETVQRQTLTGDSPETNVEKMLAFLVALQVCASSSLPGSGLQTLQDVASTSEAQLGAFAQPVSPAPPSQTISTDLSETLPSTEMDISADLHNADDVTMVPDSPTIKSFQDRVETTTLALKGSEGELQCLESCPSSDEENGEDSSQESAVIHFQDIEPQENILVGQGNLSLSVDQVVSCSHTTTATEVDSSAQKTLTNTDPVGTLNGNEINQATGGSDSTVPASQEDNTESDVKSTSGLDENSSGNADISSSRPVAQSPDVLENTNDNFPPGLNPESLLPPAPSTENGADHQQPLHIEPLTVSISFSSASKLPTNESSETTAKSKHPAPLQPHNHPPSSSTLPQQSCSSSGNLNEPSQSSERTEAKNLRDGSHGAVRDHSPAPNPNSTSLQTVKEHYVASENSSAEAADRCYSDTVVQKANVVLQKLNQYDVNDKTKRLCRRVLKSIINRDKFDASDSEKLRQVLTKLGKISKEIVKSQGKVQLNPSDIVRNRVLKAVKDTVALRRKGQTQPSTSAEDTSGNITGLTSAPASTETVSVSHEKTQDVSPCASTATQPSSATVELAQSDTTSSSQPSASALKEPSVTEPSATAQSSTSSSEPRQDPLNEREESISASLLPRIHDGSDLTSLVAQIHENCEQPEEFVLCDEEEECTQFDSQYALATIEKLSHQSEATA